MHLCYILLLLAGQTFCFTQGATEPCWKNVLKEFYQSLQEGMEGLIASDLFDRGLQKVSMMDVGLPLSFSDFSPGETKQSAQAALENVLPLVDKIYRSDISGSAVTEGVDNSLSSVYGSILKQVAPSAIDDNVAKAAREYLQELVDNPELVVSSEPALPRYLLYNYYRSNYLNMKSLEENSIDSHRQQMSSRTFEEWGQKELSVIEGDTHIAFQKWQVFGYKYEVEAYLQLIDMDSHEEDKLLSRISLYKSMARRSSRDVHETIHPVLLKPENWYQELKTNPPQSTDELRYRKSLLLAQQAMLIGMKKEIDDATSTHLSNHIGNITSNLEVLQGHVNNSVERLLDDELECFTNVNSSSCADVNGRYTNFRFTLDQIAEHFAQVNYLETILYGNLNNSQLIDETLEEVASNLTVIDAKIAVAKVVEQEETLDISTDHSVPLGTSCSEYGHVQFSFSSPATTGDCAVDSDECKYQMVPSNVLDKGLWNVQSCSVDDELKSFYLYDSFVAQMNNAAFNVTASLRKVVVERPWFDANLFEEARHYKMASEFNEFVSPGPLLPSSYFDRVISSKKYLLPQYVHAFILASDITFYYPTLGSWEFSDESGVSIVLNTLMEYAFAERLTGNVGPFSFHNGASNHNYQIRRKKFNGGLMITLPGAQIVGYVMNSVPKFPFTQEPSDEVAMNVTLCECRGLYKLTACKGLDECPPCEQNCQYTNGIFQCTCFPGYTQESDGTCADIDECALDGACPMCQNTPGSYTCVCDPGFEWSDESVSCEDIDECAANPCDQFCQNIPGSYECSCDSGYTLNSDFHTCDDIDECESNPCEFLCVNTVGSYVCASGHITRDDGTVEDIDECALGISHCEQLCSNTDGSYECGCWIGYEWNYETQSCDDVDECAQGTHSCEQVCSNEIGTYTCSCYEGWQLNTDGRTCGDVDECALGLDGCGQTCINTPGTFTCRCESGYSMGNDGRSCNDQDECALGTHDCAQVCINTPGSYTCSCNPGYELADDNRSCNDIDECALGVCDHNCVNSVGSYTCSCRTGYQLNVDGHTCNDIDECALNVDNCEHNCHNTDGSFHCSCNNLYLLNDNGYSCEITCVSADKQPGCCTSSCQVEGACWCDRVCFTQGDCCADATEDCVGKYVETISGGVDNDGIIVIIDDIETITGGIDVESPL